MKKCVCITIKGRVQGVGFRYSTMEAAKRFGIKGFVKNKVNGNVYVEAEGEYEKLMVFMKWCQQGPQLSRVDECIIDYCPLQNFTEFKVKY